MKTIFTAVFNPIKFSSKSSIYDMTSFEKSKHIIEQIQKTKTFIEETLKISEDKYLCVFVAPEWYFRTRQGCYGLLDVSIIVESVVEASKKMKNFLILPGTIYYGTDESNIKSVCNCTIAVSNGNVLSIVHKIFEYDLLGEKECWYLYDTKNIKIEDDSQQKDVFENCGKLYEKRSKEIFELLEIVNCDTAGIFEWEGLRLGVEICRDHRSGRLVRFSNIKQLLDIHIVIGAGVGNTLKNPLIKPGGIGIVIDSDYSNSSPCLIKCLNVDDELKKKYDPSYFKTSEMILHPINLETGKVLELKENILYKNKNNTIWISDVQIDVEEEIDTTIKNLIF